MDKKYVQCAAKCCGNKLLERSDLTYFTFPTNVQLAEIWARNANLSFYYAGSTLCSEHFDNKYLTNKCGRKVFKENVKPIPTLFATKELDNYDSFLLNVTTPLELEKFEEKQHFNTKKSDVIPEMEYCRLCAKLFQADTLLNIFGASNYSELLEICLPGKFLEADDLSHKICVTCVSKLENCCTIITSFIEADKKLRNIPKPSTSHQTHSDSPDEIIDILSVPEKEVIQFQCIMCPSVFNKKEDIILHAFHSHPTSRGNKIISNIIKTKVSANDDKDLNQTRNKSKIFQCIICMETLNTKEDVIAHTKTKHKILSCDKILTKVIRLEQEKPKLNVKFMCVCCPTMFDSKDDIIKHSLLKHRQNKIISKSIIIKRNVSKLQRNLTPVTVTAFRGLKKRTPEYTETFQIKYQCLNCPILFNSYKNVLDHAELLHPTLKDSGLVASLVKVRNSDSSNNDKENNQIISINDDTIIEIDPNIKLARRKLKTEMRYKCLKCFKLFVNKKNMLEHSLSEHKSDLAPDSNEIKCKLIKVKKREIGYEDRYECLICSTQHLTKSGLIFHTRYLHPSIGNDKFLCRFVTRTNIQNKECLHCNVFIKSYSYYRKHMHKHFKFTCEECGENFKKGSHLKAHLQIHEPSKAVTEDAKTYTCVTCEKTFPNKVELHIHEKIHKIPKDVTCSKCNKVFTCEYEVKKHERNTHTMCLCDVCGKTYEIKYYRNHLQIHNTNNPRKCKLCTKSFKTSSSLSKHKIKCHFPNQIKQVMCQICGKICLRESINLHMKIHTGEKPWSCEICGMSFLRKDHLKNHKKTHMHSEIYTCKICKIDLFNQRSYRNHFAAIHKGLKPDCLSTKSNGIYTCDICKKEYKFKLHYEDHLRMHAGQRIYSCNVCNKSFGTNMVLLQHKKTHLNYDELPFQCDICEKKFRRIENLRNHKRVHTGEKPFPCPICHRPFRVRGEMVKHMRIHTQRNEKRQKISSLTISETDNLLSGNDSNSFEGIGSNMPSLD